ncbi:aromatic ring-hydroxylating dioxygenase subunit alpha [Phenylobacterium sp.]|uniref:aromatic ring-hydroxylating oxygenase subunit alpha n=1 Tax=Phenylobacterium sp. TaxID=1871053 RepID=UPI0025FE3D1F|nr:aromatic ring-hydroxylating dioxygenase subunit alpha [Phenylobacterium sp.]
MAQTTTYVEVPSAPAAKPAAAARLESSRYTSRAFMTREWDQMWTCTWLLAGMECDLQAPGDFFVFSIGRESIIVTRTKEGGVSAVYNVCQHRGNRLLVKERGCHKAITCPYHGWSYDLEGRLRATPDADRFSQGIDRDALSLKPVKVELWAGLVWINMNPNAEPLGHFLGPIPQRLAPYCFERMTLVADQTVSLDANWKTVIDNFNEQYHVDFLHPQHASFVDCCNAANQLWPHGHRSVQVEGFVVNPRYPVPDEVPAPLRAAIAPLGMDPGEFAGRVPDLRKAVQRQKREVGASLGYDYSAFSDDQLTDVWQYDLFPNVIMTVQAEELWVMRPRPHPSDPDKCFFDKWTLRTASHMAATGSGIGLSVEAHASGVCARPEREVFTQEDVDAGKYSMNITIDQDVHLLRYMQAGMHSRGFRQAFLNDDESRVQHFHD